MNEGSIRGLGQATALPLATVLKHLPKISPERAPDLWGRGMFLGFDALSAAELGRA